MTMDQASGLRQWASQQQDGQEGRCPTHVAQALLELARQSPGEPPAARVSVPPPERVASAAAGRSAAMLMVVGLPGAQLGRARDLLAYWHEQGRRWVGDPAAWQLVPVAAESPHLPLLASQQPRWALWVEADAEGFRRAWRLLLSMAEAGGPCRLLLVHPPGIRRRGLLENLQQAAAHYLGIELVVLA